MKLGTYAYYIISNIISNIISMTITCFHDDRLLLEKSHAIFIKNSSNSLTVARMEVKLGAHVYYIVSMTTTTNSLRHKILLHSTNFPMLACIEMKLSMYAYYIIISFPSRLHVSMTTAILFEKASGKHSSNLLTVACMEVKLWCSRVLRRFHDNHNNK